MNFYDKISLPEAAHTLPRPAHTSEALTGRGTVLQNGGDGAEAHLHTGEARCAPQR